MRPKAPDAWGNVDAAADDALSALRNEAARSRRGDGDARSALLRAGRPRRATPAQAARSAWCPASPSPTRTATPSPARRCSTDIRTALASGSLDATKQAAATDFQAKATERCNADDDTRADAFSAQALAIAGH